MKIRKRTAYMVRWASELGFDNLDSLTAVRHVNDLTDRRDRSLGLKLAQRALTRRIRRFAREHGLEL